MRTKGLEIGGRQLCAKKSMLIAAITKGVSVLTAENVLGCYLKDATVRDLSAYLEKVNPKAMDADFLQRVNAASETEPLKEGRPTKDVS